MNNKLTRMIDVGSWVNMKDGTGKVASICSKKEGSRYRIRIAVNYDGMAILHYPIEDVLSILLYHKHGKKYGVMACDNGVFIVTREEPTIGYVEKNILRLVDNVEEAKRSLPEYVLYEAFKYLELAKEIENDC